MKAARLFLLTLSVLVNAATVSAQRWAVAVNAADALALGTVSVEGAVAVQQHTTINVTAKVNPWTFRKGTAEQFQARQQTYSVGARWWPWNVYSGWWVAGRAQYLEYNSGGIFSSRTEEGDAYGLRLGAGYALMLGKHFNMDFGLELWGGRKIYTVYACPTCGKVIDKGRSWFVMPSDLVLSFEWIF